MTSTTTTTSVYTTIKGLQHTGSRQGNVDAHSAAKKALRKDWDRISGLRGKDYETAVGQYSRAKATLKAFHQTEIVGRYGG